MWNIKEQSLKCLVFVYLCICLSQNLFLQNVCFLRVAVSARCFSLNSQLWQRKTYLFINFFVLKYFRFSFIFYIKKATPLKKFAYQVPSRFENLVGCSMPPSSNRKGGFTICVRWSYFLPKFRFFFKNLLLMWFVMRPSWPGWES